MNYERLIREYATINPVGWENLVGPDRSVDDYLSEYRYIPDIAQRLCNDLGLLAN